VVTIMNIERKFINFIDFKNNLKPNIYIALNKKETEQEIISYITGYLHALENQKLITRNQMFELVGFTWLIVNGLL